MVRKSQEKLKKMTKVRKRQVKMGVFEKSQEKFKKKKHQNLSVQIYQIPYISIGKKIIKISPKSEENCKIFLEFYKYT